jgi:hypothetical protein
MIHQKFERTLSAGVVALGLVMGMAQAQDAAPVYPTGLTNIAAATSGGRIIEATSTLDNSPQYAPENLIDGQVYNTATSSGTAGWASNKFDPVAMDAVTIGFKDNEIQKIGKIVINPSSSLNPERWAKDIELQVSTTAATGPFTPVAQITLKRSPEPQEFVILPADARFVRLMIRSNWGSDRSAALGEVEIYTAIDQNDKVGGVIARLESAIRDLRRYSDTQNEIQVNMGARPTAARGTVRGGEITGGNIASAANGGKIANVTSVFNNDPLFKAENLIDGQVYDLAADKGSFGWASQGFAPNRQWVTLGFKDDRSRLVSKFVLNPVSNQSTPRWATRIDVQVTQGSPADGPFRTVGTFNLRPEAANQDFEIRPVEAKYVRFVFTANGPGNPSPLGDPSVSSDRSVSLGEIEIYEPNIVSNDLTPILGRFNQVLVDLKRMNGQNPQLNPIALGSRRNSVKTVSAAKASLTPVAKPLAKPVAPKPVAANPTNVKQLKAKAGLMKTQADKTSKS